MLFDLTSEEQGEFSHGQTWGEIWKWFLEELTADAEAKEPEAERTGFPGSELGSAGGARLSPGPVLSLPLVNPTLGTGLGGGSSKMLTWPPSHLDLLSSPSLPPADACPPWTHTQVGTPLTRVDVSNWQEFTGCQPPCLSPSSSIQSQSQAGTAGVVAPKGVTRVRGSESGSAGSWASWMGLPSC